MSQTDSEVSSELAAEVFHSTIHKLVLWTLVHTSGWENGHTPALLTDMVVHFFISSITEPLLPTPHTGSNQVLRLTADWYHSPIILLNCDWIRSTHYLPFSGCLAPTYHDVDQSSSSASLSSRYPGREHCSSQMSAHHKFCGTILWTL